MVLPTLNRISRKVTYDSAQHGKLYNNRFCIGNKINIIFPKVCKFVLSSDYMLMCIILLYTKPTKILMHFRWNCDKHFQE